MSGREDEKGNKEGEGGGWASTFLKVATAAAATVVVAGGLYIALKKPEAEHVAVGSSSNEKQEEEEEEISVWTKPMIGWVKLNVDGSLLPQSAGCGGVLRDASGKWISGFAQKLSPTSRVDETEKEAILRGLRWAKRKGVRKLAVESDNKGIVEAVKSVRKTNDTLISDIRKERLQWEEIPTLTWIRRKDANQVADKITDNAHHLLSFRLKEYGPDDIPENCRDAYIKDLY